MDFKSNDIKKQLYSNENEDPEDAFNLIEFTLVVDSNESNGNHIENNELLILYIIEKLAAFHSLNSKLEDHKKLRVVIYDISDDVRGKKTVSLSNLMYKNGSLIIMNFFGIRRVNFTT